MYDRSSIAFFNPLLREQTIVEAADVYEALNKMRLMFPDEQEFHIRPVKKIDSPTVSKKVEEYKEQECVQCKETKPLTVEFFYKHNSCRLGWRNRCKICFHKGPPPPKEIKVYGEGKKVCRVCNKAKPKTSEFWYTATTSKDKLAYRCKCCWKITEQAS